MQRVMCRVLADSSIWVQLPGTATSDDEQCLAIQIADRLGMAADVFCMQQECQSARIEVARDKLLIQIGNSSRPWLAPGAALSGISNDRVSVFPDAMLFDGDAAGSCRTDPARLHLA